jgi:hypothetical protein
LADFGEVLTSLLAPIILGLLAIFIIVEIIINQLEVNVYRWLTLAERDFNYLLSSGMGQGGRLERVAERREWNKMAQIPTVQINTGDYRSVAHQLIETNEKELAGKGSTMGKATITAFLLRELYEADVDAAQIKIFADTRNSSDGRTPPYIAPGIYELVGFDKFNPATGFPPNAGVPAWLLRRVVRKWNFPRGIRSVTTDESGIKIYRDPRDALAQLIQQNL